MNMKPRHWLLSLLALVLMASCASPDFRRVTYPDGFLLITRSAGPTHLTYAGAQKASPSANSITGISVDYPTMRIESENARRIPCVEGHGFGMDVLLLGLPDGFHDVTVEITHPLFLPPDDQRGTTHRRHETLKAEGGVALWDFAWLFDEATQRVPGKWRVRLFHRDKLIFQDSVVGVAPKN